MMKVRGSESGFNLVELMVVVTIIGVLAGIAVPKFATFKARAVQTEAKSGLNGLFTAMEGFRTNGGLYPAGCVNTDKAIGTDGKAVASKCAATIGYSLSGGSANKYDYYIVSAANGEGWAAGAQTNTILIDKKKDAWRINANKSLCAAFDAITGATASGCSADSATASVTIKPTMAATDCVNGSGSTDCT